MASTLADQPSLTAIKRAKLKDLLKLADDRGIDMSAEIRNSVKSVREVVLASLFPEEGESEDEEIIDNEGASVANNQQLELRKLEMEHERQEREKDRELEREKWEYERQLLDRRNVSSEGSHFRISECQRSVPNFEEEDIEKFFSQFEHVATSLDWPHDKWNLILQFKLRGKASRAYSSLRSEDKDNYEKLKEAVRMAYQLTSEAYRQKFRDMRKSGNESYCDFAAKSFDALGVWLRSEEVEADYESLRELILLEDFKNKLPVAVRVYLEDQGVKSVRRAAELADRYTLIHKGQISKTPLSNANGQNDRNKQASVKCYKCSKVGHIAANCRSRDGNENRVSSRLSAGSKPFIPKCTYCGKVGHVVGSCFAKKRAEGNMVGFVQSNVAPVNRPELSYNKYLSQATIGTEENGPVHGVTMFRDTGAFVSLIRSSAVKYPELSSTGESLVIQTVGSVYQTVPLHKFYINSRFVQGEVVLGMVDSLPLPGIDILLGNDLADKNCAGRESLLHISSQPLSVAESDEELSDAVFPACVTTRSMTLRAKADNDVMELSEDCLPEIFDESVQSESKQEKGEENPTLQSKTVDNEVTGFGINLDRRELLKHQKGDESLSEIWAKVDGKPDSEFHVQDDMLMRSEKTKLWYDKKAKLESLRQGIKCFFICP